MLATLAATTALILGGSLSAPRVIANTPTSEVAPPVATANSIVVAEPVCIGADLATCSTFPALLRSRLAATGFDVRNPGPTAPCADASCGAKLAQIAGARSAVTLLAVRLDGAMILDVTMVSANGAIEHSDRTRIGGMADLDPLSARLATALSERVTFGKTMTASNVTRGEAIFPLVKRRPNLLIGAQLTGMTPVGGYHGVGYLSGGELTAWLEAGDYLVYGAAGSAAGERDDVRVNEGYLDGGVFRVFGDGDVAPFAGGGIGSHGFAMSKGEDELGDRVWEERGGNALFLGGGAMMLRTTRLNVFVLGKYTVDLFSLDGEAAPHGLTISAGAAFRF